MIRSIFLIATLLISSGCASITRGTSEAYVIQSEPPGASASLSSGLRCQTPCSLKVKRRSDFTVLVEKKGYESVTATVTSSIDGAGAAGMAGNVLVGGIIGAGIDAGTGAMHSHKPNPLIVRLIRLESADNPRMSSERLTVQGVDPLDMSAESKSVVIAPENDQDESAIDPLDMSTGGESNAVAPETGQFTPHDTGQE